MNVPIIILYLLERMNERSAEKREWCVVFHVSDRNHIYIQRWKKQNNYEKCIAAQRENAYNFYEEAFPLFLQGRFYVLPSLALLHSDITYKKFQAFIEICMVWGCKE